MAIRNILLTGAIALCAACAHDPQTPAAATTDPIPSTAPNQEEGFVTLFDGQNTEGWQQAGPGGMQIADGVARTQGGMGLWYYAKPYKDFILRLQFKQQKASSNAGVFVRFPRVDGDPWIPVKEGYEIQIDSNEVSKKHTGAVYTFAAPTHVPLKDAGQWNDYEIKVVGQHYEISLNGELITTFEGERATEGMIGLQNHSEHDTVEFKNVRIKAL